MAGEMVLTRRRLRSWRGELSRTYGVCVTVALSSIPQSIAEEA
jgi:hypothetical protein